MSWEYGLLDVLGSEEKENIGIRGAVVGTVLSVSPLKISLLNGAALVDESIHAVYVSEIILEGYRREMKALVDNVEYVGEMSFTDTIKEGDSLMIIPNESGQTFFIVSKVKKLGSD